MHFENALQEAFYYYPIHMWLLLLGTIGCLIGFVYCLVKDKKFKHKAWQAGVNPEWTVQHNFPPKERKETE